MFVLWGPSGVGKTTIADAIAGGSDHVYRVRYPESGDLLRFEGYDAGQHTCVLFDEFEGQIKLDLWKRLCDKWPVRVRNFGGDEDIRPTLLVFTSNLPLSEWWHGQYNGSQSHVDAINRRITVNTKITGFADADRFVREYQRLHQPAPVEMPRPEPLGPAFGGDDLDDIDLSDFEIPDDI